MTMILAAFKYWQIGVGIVAGCLIMFAYSAAILQPQAREEGRAMERTEALERSMDIIRQRSKTNAEIDRLSPNSLCIELGGNWVHEDNECR